MDGDAGGSKMHEAYHAGLRDLHSLEMTAVELTERQVERLENYPEMAARLRQHKVESEHQAQRLEQDPAAARRGHFGGEEHGGLGDGQRRRGAACGAPRTRC